MQTKPPEGSSPIQYLNLYAEDWPVLHKTIGLQPGKIRKAHCITTKSVHIFITARLWGKQKKNQHRQENEVHGCLFILLCTYHVHQVGGWEQTQKDRTRFSRL